jgi:regulator of protease activity HflC (stomatin/prohibitin superfamily)
MILLTSLLWLLAAVFFFIDRADTRRDEEKSAWPILLIRGLTTLGALTLIIGLLQASYRSIPAGNRGVLLRFGAVRGDLTEGAHFIVPFVDDVALVDVQTQKADGQASAASKDLQTVDSEVAVNYHVAPSAVGDLYRNVGVDFDDRIIQPAIQETLKAAVAQYTAEELIRKRADVKAQVDAGLTQRLAAYNIIVESNGVSLTNFDFSPEFNAAIEAKQVAEQQAEQQKYVLAQATLQAQTAITQAKGEAESNRIKAAALNTQGGQKVLARAWIDKWDGHLPTVTGSGQQMLNLSDLIGGGK